MRLQMTDPQGQPVGEAQEVDVQITEQAGDYVFMVDVANPQLWYPNGMGDQPLYQARVEMLSASGVVTDSRQVTFGIRTIRAISNVGASTHALPYTIEVNGRRMYVKGWNWAPIDNLYGRPQVERYERLLTLAQHAHCNLLRVWGGGLLEREEFYNLCDKLGILIWQEFHHSSSGVDNRPPADDEYLAYIEQLARQMVPLRRNHAALAIWCGGNELMEDNSVPLTDAHPALARLKAIVQELDPERIWLPTSSSGPVEGSDPKLAGTGQMHDVHGPWQYQGPKEQYRFFNTIDPLYHSEFGAEGAANLYTLKRYLSPKYHFPPDATNPAWVHHGSWWLHREKLEEMFGKFTDIATFVRASQWMQAEGLRYVIEADRRRKWHTSGSSPWQLNEAFPNASCTNSIDYLGLTKPAFWWVRRGYEPTHISARYDSISFKPQDEWRAEFWANNSLAASEGCQWSAQLMDLQGQIVLSTGGSVDLPDDGVVRVGEITQKLPVEPGVFILFLSLSDASGKLLSRNEYTFSTFDPPFQAMLNGPAPVLKVNNQHGNVSITNESTTPALFVQFEPVKGQWITPADDYFCLLPGETRSVQVTGKGSVAVRAWNSQTSLIRLS
jgi:beta-mannosidase